MRPRSAKLARVAARVDSLPHIAVFSPVLGEVRRQALLVALVVSAPGRGVVSRMPPPPTAHGFARFLGISFDPVARILPALLSVLVRHETYVAARRCRGNRTRNKNAAPMGRVTVAGRRFERLAFGL